MASDKTKKVKGKLKRYKVWVSQVNATCFEVDALDIADAKRQGEIDWRKKYAFATVTQVQPMDPLEHIKLTGIGQSKLGIREFMKASQEPHICDDI